MVRGGIWQVDFDRNAGHGIKKLRPAVIVSVDALNRARGTVLVAPLSSSPATRPPIVVATPSAGRNSVAVCDQLCAADKCRLVNKIGALSRKDLGALTDALKIILGLC